MGVGGWGSWIFGQVVDSKTRSGKIQDEPRVSGGAKKLKNNNNNGGIQKRYNSQPESIPNGQI